MDCGLFIKVFREKEYREQFINGNIYFRKSKCFRSGKEKARDDHSEGRIYNNPQKYDFYVDGVKLEGVISAYTEVNEYGEALICCASQLQPNKNCTLQFPKNNRLQINLYEDFQKELRSFGKYCVIFDGGMLVNKVSEYTSQNNIVLNYGAVTYFDFEKDETDTKYHNILKDKTYIKILFIKDQAYALQYEYRLALLNTNNCLVPKDKDCYIVKLEDFSAIAVFDFD